MWVFLRLSEELIALKLGLSIDRFLFSNSDDINEQAHYVVSTIYANIMTHWNMLRGKLET